MTDRRRINIIKDRPHEGGPVVYWMGRDQRVKDNWALSYAQELALEHKVPLLVLFNLVPGFLGGTLRQYDFMMRGLREVEGTLRKLNIPFFLLSGSPGETLPRFLRLKKAGALVADFSPLRIYGEWKREVARPLGIPFHEVDAHNIVPCRLASAKMEYGAYTLRPKITRLLPEFLEKFPVIKKHTFSSGEDHPVTNWEKVIRSLKVDREVQPLDWLLPGEKEAMRTLENFIENRLKDYDSRRNDPLAGVNSDLSAHLHFGQISAQRVAFEVARFGRHLKSAESFLEELIVRRELSDNFCLYNKRYDSVEGFPEWGRLSLKKHRKDRREHIYTAEQFENGLTSDPLWNAAQAEMVKRGKMHSYMRMYWAKKILEWSRSPEEALATAIRLNDKYGIDGRDPNGYAGIAWSVGGVHDRAWGEREIFGKIRYMNETGCKRKFDVKSYIAGNLN